MDDRGIHLMPLRLIIRAALLTLFITIPGRASELEPVRLGQESFISNAVFANSQLWLLTDAGVISSITEGSDSQIDIPIPEPAFALWVQDGEPALVTGERRDGKYWTLRKWNHGAWTESIKVATNGDEFLGIGASDGAVTLLTSRRMIDIAGSNKRSVALNWPRKQTGGITSVLVTRDNLLVGFNLGEWGGGLRRIDRKTGIVSIVERKASGDLCSGTLTSDCDPVNGIAVEPWNENCAVIAIGLVHMMAHGSIAEVCGSRVKRLYVKPYPDEVYSTVPFFGVRATGGDLWAISTDGIYQIGADGVAKISALPAFRQIGNVSVSFELPHLVLVLTNVNQRRAVSGSVPMMVPR
jgi:hypothetical protein